jgi:large subunit ribosomal protein L13
MKQYRTYMAKPAEARAAQQWHVVDAEGKTLGRLSSQIAKIIMGKHKATYTPHVDTGDFVVVINASKIKVTGTRLTDKMYYSHSLYVGGLRSVPLSEVLEKKPERAIRSAVWGMIPKGRLGHKMIKKLKVYGGATHEHAAQNPKPLHIEA